MSKYLEELAAAQQELQRQHTEVVILAIQARNDGATWPAIGRALGTTKQAAQRRFSKYVISPLQSPGHGA